MAMLETGGGAAAVNVHHGVTLSIAKDDTKDNATSAPYFTRQFSQKVFFFTR